MPWPDGKPLSEQTRNCLASHYYKIFVISNLLLRNSKQNRTCQIIFILCLQTIVKIYVHKIIPWIYTPYRNESVISSWYEWVSILGNTNLVCIRPTNFPEITFQCYTCHLKYCDTSQCVCKHTNDLLKRTLRIMDDEYGDSRSHGPQQQMLH